ncbi:MAG: ABC transporter permease, partial [Chloroflexota bacterium]|nr:ABC transporter permease [Chloroflexota bacterium]
MSVLSAPAPSPIAARWRTEQQLPPVMTLWRDAARRFRRNKLAVAALAVMVFLVAVAVFADVIAPARYDFSNLAEANQFPNAKHWLGTDSLGRDFLSRLIYATRVSLTVGISVQVIAVAIGVTLGAIAGTVGGWADYVVMRWVEVLTAIPIWLFALFLISIWRASDAMAGGGMFHVIIAIGLIGWVAACRLTRAQLLSL